MYSVGCRIQSWVGWEKGLPLARPHASDVAYRWGWSEPCSGPLNRRTLAERSEVACGCSSVTIYIAFSGVARRSCRSVVRITDVFLFFILNYFALGSSPPQKKEEKNGKSKNVSFRILTNRLDVLKTTHNILRSRQQYIVVVVHDHRGSHNWRRYAIEIHVCTRDNPGERDRNAGRPNQMIDLCEYRTQIMLPLIKIILVTFYSPSLLRYNQIFFGA